MLRLTRTAIGLLTRQYRSVLKKCWAINVGAWLFGAIGKTATTLLSQTLRGTLKMSDTEIFKVLDGLSEKRVFKTKLITSTAIGLMVATMAMPSDAYAGYGIAVEGELDGYAENSIYSYYYAKYTRSSGRSNFIDVQTSAGNYFDLETFLVDLSEGRLFVSGAITTHDIRTGAVTSVEIASNTITSNEIANGAITDAKIASGITASKITQNASYLFVNATEKAIWNGYSTTIAGKADKATTLSGYGITDAYTKTQVDNLISGSGSGSSYSAGTGISLEDKVISLDSDYLDNNYYRKNKKSGILNGFEEWKKDDI